MQGFHCFRMPMQGFGLLDMFLGFQALSSDLEQLVNGVDLPLDIPYTQGVIS